jgi:hypothetical protein
MNPAPKIPIFIIRIFITETQRPERSQEVVNCGQEAGNRKRKSLSAFCLLCVLYGCVAEKSYNFLDMLKRILHRLMDSF